MNFLAVLKQIFSSRPTLEEFISIHNPQSEAQVELLTKRYYGIVNTNGFSH